MFSLGNFFPDNLKNEFSRRNVKVGSVLRLKVEDTNPPKIQLLLKGKLRRSLVFTINFGYDLLNSYISVGNVC